MAEELPDAPWAAPASAAPALPDAPWASTPKPAAATPSLLSRLASPITDIPKETYHAVADPAISAAKNLNPFSPERKAAMMSGDVFGQMGQTGRGVMSAIAAPFGLLTGPARSVIGHPFSWAMPTATPEQQAKLRAAGAGENIIPRLDEAENYEKAKGGVDLAMSGMGARWRGPSNAPALPPVEPGAPMGGAEMLGARNQRYWREGPGAEPPPAPSSIVIPEGAPVAMPRENLGVRLLPADAAHAPHVPVPLTPAEQAAQTLRRFGYDDSTIGTMGPGTQLRTAEMLERNYPGGPPGASSPGLGASRNAGAAGTEMGPLTDISPQTIAHVRTMLKEEGFTPYTLEQRLAEMSAHEFLGELTPNTRLDLSGMHSLPGQARTEIGTVVRQRAHEAPERMNAIFDRAFGPGENRSQLQRMMKIDRDAQSRPFWQAFRRTEIPTTPDIEAILPRLEASGSLKAANRALAEEGIPAQSGFNVTGDGTHVPTASAFQYAKEHLDGLIKQSIEAGNDNAARRYTKLKNDLVSAIDNHPSGDVANIWKQARDVYAEPTVVMNAMKMGERVLTGNIHAEELPFLTASFGPAELRAFNIGIRGRLQDIAGRPGKTDLKVINEVLAPSNQEKIRWSIGDKKAEELIGAIEHELRMHHAPGDLIHNSMTAARTAAQKRWMPPESSFSDMKVGDVVGAVANPKGSLIKGAMKGADALVGSQLAKRAAKAAAEFNKIRDESARIYTLQGAERDAVLRHLLEVPPDISGHAAGGRVFARASGGRIAKSMMPKKRVA